MYWSKAAIILLIKIGFGAESWFSAGGGSESSNFVDGLFNPTAISKKRIC